MNKELLRTIKFTIFSASAGIIELGVSTLLNRAIGLEYWPSYLIALVCSVLWNFTLNRNFTFKSASNVPKAMLLVFCYYIVFTPLSTILGNHLVKDLHCIEELVTILNMIINFVTEYLYDRFIVFRKSIDTAKVNKS